jgi:hypothetical protein
LRGWGIEKPTERVGGDVLEVMKTRYFVFCILALASFVLSGCATDTTTTTTTTAETDLTKKRVHTQKDLKKTGESETGEALEKVDPAVRTSGSR